MAAYIAIVLSLISIILMIVILVRFKKLFSTDSIIEKTQHQMNKVIMDINNNANRDIELINESTKRTKALLKDADIKMDQFREATQLLRDVIAEAEKSTHKNPGRNVKIEHDYSRMNGQFQQKSSINNPYNNPYVNKNNNSYINPDSAYEIKKDENQRSLFDDENLLKDETNITPDGAAYKEVPLIITKIYDDQTYEQKKSAKPLKDKVEKLFKQGMNVDDIAAELSCSIAEVQFIIDML